MQLFEYTGDSQIRRCTNNNGTNSAPKNECYLSQRSGGGGVAVACWSITCWSRDVARPTKFSYPVGARHVATSRDVARPTGNSHKSDFRKKNEKKFPEGFYGGLIFLLLFFLPKHVRFINFN